MKRIALVTIVGLLLLTIPASSQGVGIGSLVKMNLKFQTTTKNVLGKDEGELRNTMSVISNPSGTRLVVGPQYGLETLFEDESTTTEPVDSYGTIITTIDMTQMDPETGMIPESAIEDEKDMTDFGGYQYITTSIFLDDETLLISTFDDSSSPDDLQRLIHTKVVPDGRLDDTDGEKAPQDYGLIQGSTPGDYPSDDEQGLSTSRKNGVVAITGGLDLVIIKEEFTSVITDLVNFRSLTFDETEGSNLLFAFEYNEFVTLDYTAIESSTESRADVEQSTDDLVLGGDFTSVEMKQNSLNPNKLLVGIMTDGGERLYNPFFYFDIEDPNNVKLEATASMMRLDTNAEPAIMDNGIQSVHETELFLALLFGDADKSLRILSTKLLLVDPTWIPDEREAKVYDLLVFDITSVLAQSFPPGIPNGGEMALFNNFLVTSIARVGDMGNTFAFAVNHFSYYGDDNNDDNLNDGAPSAGPSYNGFKASATKAKLSVIGVEFGWRCHFTCGTCSSPNNPTACRECSANIPGLEFKSIATDALGNAIGTCIPNSEPQFDVGIIETVEDPLLAVCGGTGIAGCAQCSVLGGENLCARCETGLGLDGYNNDFSAGAACVDCPPISGCIACDLVYGQTERRCTACADDFELKEVNGRQYCFRSIFGLGLLAFSMLMMIFSA